MTVPTYPYRKMSRNWRGRDFVVGDLHGCYSMLRRALSGIGFDETVDRLFSTGDLIDRGPEPLECLRLLEEPWFFAVVGNHERMLRSRVGSGERLRTRVQAAFHSGEWLPALSGTQRAELIRLAGLIGGMPGVLEVESGKNSFFVVHAQRPFIDRSPMSDVEFRSKGADSTYLEATTWGRQLFHVHASHIASGLPLETGLVEIEPSDGERLTYVGHSIVKYPTRVGSHVFLDGGAYRKLRGEPGSLFIVEHAADEGPRVAYPTVACSS
ncbi:metallophosphoesterase [Burkholderia cenocepacia]|uniref:metallophosphoesterase n=1 Tax=Burkholderia cenocepacia TaxID=95486 RepID=UPI00076C3AFD|nr:metallophosphoesterase [Burkholderia cenocepacia]KWU17927.1 hypothetical protein AS149_14735 [Burkholderia cenocepacia]